MEQWRCAVNARLRLVVLVLPLSLTACEWFTDFKRQPSIWTWEQVKDSTTPSRGNPQMSVPINGSAVAGFQVSYGAFPATIDSMAGIPNPTPVSDASLANGRKYFQINCSPCHGDRAMGDGPATRYGMPGINLTQDITKARTDGYIFGMIRNGRGLMPSYNRIEESDRWDVVNYVRALQGMNGRNVPVGPLAAPGVTGDKVPRSTRTGPNVPAPFYNPRALLAPGQSTPAEAPTAQQGLPAGGATNAPSPGAPMTSDTSRIGAPRTRADSAKRATDSLRRGIR
jgi:mono/diheme cytochrome c family protein